MIVVDVGCSDRPDATDGSVQYLAERFQPDILYGFDPNPAMPEAEYSLKGTRVVIERKAAWLQDGTVNYIEDGMWSRTHDGYGVEYVPCFDFGAWLATLEDEIIVKLDVEGAEYELLARLIADGREKLVSRWLIEWHPELDPDEVRQKYLMERLGNVEEWWR